MSKISVATDSNPVDMQSYELCSDMIDVVIDVSCIYGCVRFVLSRFGCIKRCVIPPPPAFPAPCSLASMLIDPSPLLLPLATQTPPHR